MRAKIIATGSCIPGRRVTNQDLVKHLDTSDEWIQSRTGIRSRYIAREETTSGLAALAAGDALLRSGLGADHLELIICATSTADAVFPNTACMIQRELGASRAVCYEINDACSGFLFAMNMAQAFLASGLYQYALVVGAERMSGVLDWKDRASCVLFGDGAGAAILAAEPEGLYHMKMYSNGAKGHVLTLGNPAKGEYLSMNGQEVFRFAVKEVPLCIAELLEEAGLAPEEIAYYFLHQANSRIIEAIAKRLGVPADRFPVNLDVYANTSAASIPILLHEWNQKGLLKRGDRIVLAGFGAGLTWGASVLEW